jgi:hypothetical protein
MRCYTTITVLAVAIVTTSCVHTHCRDKGGGACGDLLLGATGGGSGSSDPQPQWALYAGLALESAALVSGGVGGAQWYLSSRRKDEADASDPNRAVGERAHLLDQAEKHERTAAWALGAAAPLAVAGGIFLILHAASGNDEPEGAVGPTASSKFQVAPWAGTDGAVGVTLGLGF